MKKRLGRFRLRDDPGQAMTEFAMGVPILLLLLVASAYFAVAFNNELTLTQATTTGAQQLSISRGDTSDPCATTVTAVTSAAPGLNPADLTYSIAFGTPNTATPPTIVYGTPITGTGSGFSCSGDASDLVSGHTAQVIITYPCNLTFMGINFAPSGCTLQAQTAELIQ
jgi:Flp pilus assembly protein TadG